MNSLSLRHGFLALALAGALAGAPVQAQEDLPEFVVSSFPSPTTSFWVSNLIHELGLDEKHGFRLTVESKPSQVAYNDFVAGTSKACYCIAPAAGARFVERGSDIAQVWIVQTNTALIVTADPEIRSAKDLEGRSLGADTATGSWAIAASLLVREGVDLDAVEIRSLSNQNALAELTLGRIDAIAGSANTIGQLEVLEPGKYHVIDITDQPDILELTEGRGLPSWGFGAWNEWLDDPENADLTRKLYAATEELIALSRTDPNYLAEQIALITGLEKEALLIELEPPYWSYNLASAREYEAGLRLLASEFLPEGGQLDAPLSEENYETFISDLL